MPDQTARPENSELILKRVQVSTAGVAYLEYEAEVEEDAILSFHVRSDQIDDLMKSFVVYDSKGGVGHVEIPAEEPVEQLFHGLNLKPEELGSIPALLRALKGNEVIVTGPVAATGRVLGVREVKERSEDRKVLTSRDVLDLMTAEGLRQVELDSVTAIRVADEALNEKLQRALASSGLEIKNQGMRLQIHSLGTEKRILRVGHVVGAPLWKTSYRLTLPADPQATEAALQGWAIIENFTASDWDQVELTFISGHPLSFEQPLYAPCTLQRERKQLRVMDRILPWPRTPRWKEGGEITANDRILRDDDDDDIMMVAVAAGGTEEYVPETDEDFSRADPANLHSARIRMASSQILFSAPAPVSLQVGASILVPFLDQPCPVERFLYFPQVYDPPACFHAVRLENNAGFGLPSGTVTIYERGPQGAGYQGEVLTRTIPAGGSKLLQYAGEGGYIVERYSKDVVHCSDYRITGDSLHFTANIRAHHRIAIQTPPAKEGMAPERRCMIELPRRPDGRLEDESLEIFETLARSYKVIVTLNGPGKHMPEFTEVTANPGNRMISSILSALRTGEKTIDLDSLDGPARDMLRLLEESEATIASLDSKIDKLKKKHAALAKDQDRFRKNISSTPEGSDAQQKYTKLLMESEDQLQAMAKELADMETSRREAQERLESLPGYSSEQ